MNPTVSCYRALHKNITAKNGQLDYVISRNVHGSDLKGVDSNKAGVVVSYRSFRGFGLFLFMNTCDDVVTHHEMCKLNVGFFSLRPMEFCWFLHFTTHEVCSFIHLSAHEMPLVSSVFGPGYVFTRDLVSSKSYAMVSTFFGSYVVG